MQDSVTVRAYAKINVHLRVGQRDNRSGYHALETLFQTVGLFDTIRFRRAAAKKIRVSGWRDNVGPEGRDDLIVRAAEALRTRANVEPGARIALTKRIPLQGGLAGGSTDAAATLYGLNLLWRLNITHVELMYIAKDIGADVPFVLHGGAAAATGRGERLRFLGASSEPRWVVLVTSKRGVSTPDAFRMLGPNDKSRHIRMAQVAESTELRRIAGAWESGAWPDGTINSFERELVDRRPRLGALLNALRRNGAALAHVSGSGPTVFGLFPSRRAARQAAKHLRLRRGEQCYVVPTVPASPVLVRASHNLD